MNQPINKQRIKLTDPTRILTLANFTSLLRAVLAWPLIYTLKFYPDKYFLIFLIIAVAVISDALDGYFARKAHEVTHIGKWLDPIADFIIIFSVTFYLILDGKFPLWFFLFFAVRYISIAFLAIYMINHNHVQLSSNWYGKFAIGFTALTLTLHIFNIPAFDYVKIISLWAAFGLLMISWYTYFDKMLKAIRQQ